MEPRCPACQASTSKAHAHCPYCGASLHPPASGSPPLKTLFGLASPLSGAASAASAPAPDMNKTVFGLAPVPKGVAEPAPDTNKTVFGLAPVP
ncbi:hypothetical protein KJ940_16170, partial [Myxococcota bacterium]|nr:hypothetical protein [Myxococcota bacterium]